MTTHDEPQHRAYHQPDPDAVEYREPADDDDGMFRVRMPVASTGEVRNEGDDPFERDALEGMARQINEGDVGVFLGHGFSDAISGKRFDQLERLGSWTDASVDGDRDAADAVLMAEARIADPETLPSGTGRFREATGILKEQVKRDIPLSSSIAWREDADVPGGNDLMEVSIVGIPADPRTTTQETAGAVARAAVDAGADPDALVEAVRAAVVKPDATADSDMSETDNESGDEQSADADDEQTEREAPEWADELLELQRQQTETLSTLADAIREDDEDDEDDEDEDETESEQSADDSDADSDAGGDRAVTLTVDGEERTLAADEAVSTLRDLASEAEAVAPDDVGEDADGERDADSGASGEDADTDAGGHDPATLL